MSGIVIAPKKYELVREDFIEAFGYRLFRIRALSHFGNVSAGELGGYIEQEKNLSHSGSCWVYEVARVLGNAEILGNARVLGNACVSGDGQVAGGAQIAGGAHISGNAWVAGDAQILEQAWVCDEAQVLDNAKVLGNALVSGHACVSDEGQVSGDTQIAGHAHISGNAEVLGKVEVSGCAHLSSTAKVSSNKDFINFFYFRDINLTAYRTQSGGIEVAHKSFCGTPEAFLQRIAHQYGDGDVTQEYRRLIESAQRRLQANSLQKAVA